MTAQKWNNLVDEVELSATFIDNTSTCDSSNSWKMKVVDWDIWRCYSLTTIWTPKKDGKYLKPDMLTANNYCMDKYWTNSAWYDWIWSWTDIGSNWKQYSCYWTCNWYDVTLETYIVPCNMMLITYTSTYYMSYAYCEGWSDYKWLIYNS